MYLEVGNLFYHVFVGVPPGPRGGGPSGGSPPKRKGATPLGLEGGQPMAAGAFFLASFVQIR